MNRRWRKAEWKRLGFATPRGHRVYIKNALMWLRRSLKTIVAPRTLGS
jgi:hypothetical protein